jgi:hypothetical protein
MNITCAEAVAGESAAIALIAHRPLEGILPMMLRRLAPAAIVAAALAVAPAAMANTTATGYGGPGANQQHHVTKPKVLGVTNTGGPTTPTPTNTPVAASTGSLPFTGFDLVLVLATGMGLVIAGFGLRRLTRRESAI